MWLLQIIKKIEQEQYIYFVYDKSIWYIAGPLSWAANAAFPTANKVARAKYRLKKQVSKNFGKNEKIRSTELEKGLWKQNPLYVVNISNINIWRYYH